MSFLDKVEQLRATSKYPNQLTNNVDIGPTTSPSRTPYGSVPTGVQAGTWGAQSTPVVTPTTKQSGFLNKINELRKAQTNVPYTGLVEPGSPLSVWQRAKLSFGDEQGTKKYLEGLGYSVLTDTAGNQLVQKDGKVFRLDEAGFSFKDIADAVGKSIPFVAQIAGSIAGGVAGAPTGVGAVGGAVAGGSAGGVVGESARQGIGSLLGVSDGIDAKEIAKEGVLGGVGGATAGVSSKVASTLAGKTLFQAGRTATGEAIPTTAARVIGAGVEGGAQGSIISGGSSALQGDSLEDIFKNSMLGFVAGAPLGVAGDLALRGAGQVASKTSSAIVSKVDDATEGKLTNFIQRSLVQPLKTTLAKMGPAGKQLADDLEERFTQHKEILGYNLAEKRKAQQFFDQVAKEKGEDEALRLANQASFIAAKNSQASDAPNLPLEDVLKTVDDPTVRRFVELQFRIHERTSNINSEFGQTYRSLGKRQQEVPVETRAKIEEPKYRPVDSTTGEELPTIRYDEAPAAVSSATPQDNIQYETQDSILARFGQKKEVVSPKDIAALLKEQDLTEEEVFVLRKISDVLGKNKMTKAQLIETIKLLLENKPISTTPAILKPLVDIAKKAKDKPTFIAQVKRLRLGKDLEDYEVDIATKVKDMTDVEISNFYDNVMAVKPKTKMVVKPNVERRAKGATPMYPSKPLTAEEKRLVAISNVEATDPAIKSIIDPELRKEAAIRKLDDEIKKFKDADEFYTSRNIASARDFNYQTPEEALADGALPRTREEYTRLLDQLALQGTEQAALYKSFLKKPEFDAEGNLVDPDQRLMAKIDDVVSRVSAKVEADQSYAEGGKAKEFLKGQISDIIGVGREATTESQKWISWIKQANAAKLTGAFVSNVFQPLNSILAADFPTVAKAFSSMFGWTAGPLKGKTAREAADRAGASVSSIQETENILRTGEELNRWQKALNKMLKFFTWTEVGINRTNAANTGMFWAMKQFKNGNFEEVAKYLGDDRLAAAIERGFLDEDDLIRAGTKFMDYTQFGFNPLELPTAFTNQYASVITQFKSFGYRQLKMLMKEASAGDKRALRAIAIMATLYPASGVAQRTLKDIVSGKPLNAEEMDEEEVTAFGKWADGLMESSVLALIGDGIRSGNNNNLRAWVAGPTIDTAGKLLQAGYDTATIPASEGDPLKVIDNDFKLITSQAGAAGRLVYNVGKFILSDK